MTDGAWEHFVLCLHKSSSPAPLKCVIVNRGSRKTSESTDAMPGVSGLLSCPARAPSRFVDLSRTPKRRERTIGRLDELPQGPAIVGLHVSFADRNGLA